MDKINLSHPPPQLPFTNSLVLPKLGRIKRAHTVPAPPLVPAVVIVAAIAAGRVLLRIPVLWILVAGLVLRRRHFTPRLPFVNFPLDLLKLLGLEFEPMAPVATYRAGDADGQQDDDKEGEDADVGNGGAKTDIGCCRSVVGGGGGGGRGVRIGVGIEGGVAGVGGVSGQLHEG